MRQERRRKDYIVPSFEEIQGLPDREDPYCFPVFLPEIEGQLRILKLGSMGLSEGCLELSDNMAEQSGVRHFNDQRLLEMNFVMSGNIRQRVGFLPGEMHFVKAHSSMMDGLIGKLANDTPFMVDRPAMAYTPQMEGVIHSLWNNPFTGGVKRLYLEVKMMELLALQWDQLMRVERPVSVLRNKEDVETMHLARDLLLRNIHCPPSLAQLARMCGTNEFKLKRGFKEVFNETVFGYFNSVRLEEARLLVLSTKKTLTEIAGEMGFAHPQHFSRAFRKRFGVAPGELRK
jgi:AraC-like DNA-binding protein